MKATVFGIFDIGIEKDKNMNTDIHSHLLDSEISMNHFFELKGIYQCVSIHNQHASYHMYTHWKFTVSSTNDDDNWITALVIAV